MAELIEEKKTEKKTEKKLDIAKDASVDFPVDVIALEADPYHETGTEFKAGSKKAAELVKRGWVKMAVIALLFLASFGAHAQTSILQDLKSVSSQTTDTLTDATVVYMTTLSRLNGPHQTSSIQVVVDELSGTTAGTVVLQGSLNGVNYFTLTDSTTIPAITTWTLTDQAAAQSKIWVIKDSPYLYFRVSHSGGTTMSATITAVAMLH